MRADNATSGKGVNRMDVILKIAVRNTEQRYIDSALRLVEEIKANHPDLFQQVEVALEC